mmetsp:Transcript_29903/g.83990  ORF Transcript_29903/g.83990 Transcript_29903/m.83990 type:complete len:474 (+) Transcript_29903:210-1631(+)
MRLPCWAGGAVRRAPHRMEANWKREGDAGWATCTRRQGWTSRAVGGLRLAAARLPQHLDDVAVQRALGVVEGLVSVLILAVDLRASVDQHLHARELLVHCCPHQCRLPAPRVKLDVASPFDEELQEPLVASLDRTEECRHALGVLVVYPGAVPDEHLADLFAAKLSGEEKGRLPRLGLQVDPCLCDLHQSLHRLQVALRGGPHERGLVLVVELVHLGPLLDEELAHAPVAVRRRLHQGGLALLGAEVCRHPVLRLLHEHLADVLVALERGPHEHVPALVVLEIQGRALIEQQPDDVGLALLRRLHQGGDALVVLRVQHAPLLVGDGLRGVASPAQGDGGLLSLQHLCIYQVLRRVHVTFPTGLHHRRLPRVVFGRSPRAPLDQELHDVCIPALCRVHEGAHALGVLLVHLDLRLLQRAGAVLHLARLRCLDERVHRDGVRLALVALERGEQVARHPRRGVPVVQPASWKYKKA